MIDSTKTLLLISSWRNTKDVVRPLDKGIDMPHVVFLVLALALALGASLGL